MTENAMGAPRPLILIVDDNTTNIDLLVSTLKTDYRLGIAKNGLKALDYAARHKPDLVLMDIMMPQMDGYEACARLKADPETAAIPVIFITAMGETVNKTRGFELGAIDYITKPFHAMEVKARVRTHLSVEDMRLQLKSQNEHLARKVQEKTAEISRMLNASIRSMAMMVEIRDPYTAGHQQRVAQLACAIAAEMRMEPEMIEGIRIAGLLHDVGKIRIPISILSRAGKLLEAEFKMIRIHPQVGYDILKDIPFPWPVARMVLQHHETLDGTGYPQGLSGDDILPGSRIIAVADVIEANSSFRPYRPANGIEAALKELVHKKGKKYDGEAVSACQDLLESGRFMFDSQGPGDVQSFSGRDGSDAPVSDISDRSRIFPSR